MAEPKKAKTAAVNKVRYDVYGLCGHRIKPIKIMRIKGASARMLWWCDTCNDYRKKGRVERVELGKVRE